MDPLELTPRERRLLELAATLGIAGTAEKMEISHQSVKNQLSELYRANGFRNLAHAVWYVFVEPNRVEL